jgi:hypothetical protein
VFVKAELSTHTYIHITHRRAWKASQEGAIKRMPSVIRFTLHQFQSILSKGWLTHNSLRLQLSEWYHIGDYCILLLYTKKKRFFFFIYIHFSYRRDKSLNMSNLFITQWLHRIKNKMNNVYITETYILYMLYKIY